MKNDGSTPRRGGRPSRYVTFALLVLVLGLWVQPPAPGQDAGSGATAADAPWPAQWPRGFKGAQHEYNVFQPQLDSWDGHTLAGRSAIGVRNLEGKDPTYGVAWFQAKTQVDRIEGWRIGCGPGPHAGVEAIDLFEVRDTVRIGVGQGEEALGAARRRPPGAAGSELADGLIEHRFVGLSRRGHGQQEAGDHAS